MRCACLFLATLAIFSAVPAAAGSLWITEIRRTEPDAVEFTNVSGASLDVSGWKVYLYDSDSWPNYHTSRTIPSSTTLSAGEVFVLFEGTSSTSLPYKNFSFSGGISWPQGSSAEVGVVVTDASNNLVDVFIGCGSSTSVASTDITSPASIPASQWTGSRFLTDNGTPGLSMLRVDHVDDNNASDWAHGSGSIGTLNADFQTRPAISQISREDTSPVLTSSQVRFLVTYTQPVMNVEASTTGTTNDFVLVLQSGVLTGFSLQSVAKVSDSQYRITVATGTGSGTLRLDALSSGGAQNFFSRTMSGDYSSGPAYTVDTVSPLLSSFSASPDPAKIGSPVVLILEYNEAMKTTVTPVVAVSTASNGAIPANSVAGGGNGAWLDSDTYRVSLGRATAAADHGTATVSVSGAQDDAGRSMSASTGHTFFIDGTVPVVTVDNIITPSLNPRITGTVVDNDPAAEVLVRVLLQTREAVNNGDGTWTLPENSFLLPLLTGLLNVEATATDAAGNEGTDTTTNELLVDPISLSVASVQRLDPTPTALPAVRYLVEYSATVFNVESGSGPSDDFEVEVLSGITSGAAVTDVTEQSPTTYLVTVATGDGDGSIRLNVLNSGGITNENGGPLPASYFGAPSYTLVGDVLPPQIVGITIDDVAGPAVRFIVEFNESVAGIETGTLASTNDFAATMVSGTLSSLAITDVSSIDTRTYAVEVLPGTGKGSFRLDVLPGGGIVDSNSNAMTTIYSDGPVYAYNTVRPTLLSATASPSPAGVGSIVELTFNFDEPMDTTVFPGVTFTTQSNGGIGASSTPNGGDGAWIDADTYQVSLDRALVAQDHGTGRYLISAAQDPAGQLMNSTTQRTILIDGVQPVLTVNSLTTYQFNPNLTGTVVDNAPQAPIQVSVGAQNRQAFNHGNGNWTVSGNQITPLPQGTHTITATATDIGGNVGTATGTITIDPHYLAIENVTLLDASPTNKPFVRFRLQFSSPMSGVESFGFGTSNDFAPATAGSPADAHVQSVSLVDPRTYIVSVNIGEGDGNLGLKVLRDGGLRNPNGHPLTGDVVVPVAYSINRLKVSAPGSPEIVVEEGEDVTLQVAATGGTPPYSYDWYYGIVDGPSLEAGSTSDSLTLNNVSFINGGTYYCVVTDQNESVSSAGTDVRADVTVAAFRWQGLALLTLLIALIAACTMKHHSRQISRQ